METIGAFEAKTNLSALLRRAEHGERFTITRHGVPVAVLAPAVEPKNVKEAIKAIREARKGVRLDGLSIRDMIEEGRK
jgi:prevent-host-death family protein